MSFYSITEIWWKVNNQRPDVSSLFMDITVNYFWNKIIHIKQWCVECAVCRVCCVLCVVCAVCYECCVLWEGCAVCVVCTVCCEWCVLCVLCAVSGVCAVYCVFVCCEWCVLCVCCVLWVVCAVCTVCCVWCVYVCTCVHVWTEAGLCPVWPFTIKQLWVHQHGRLWSSVTLLQFSNVIHLFHAHT